MSGTLLGLCLAAFALLFIGLWVVRPAPGEWSHALPLGPWRVQVSVPALLRMATHPVVLHLLEGRTLHTRYGALQWSPGAQPDSWRAVCAPCTLRAPAFGNDELHWSRAELSVVRSSQNDFHGEFTLGDAPHAVRGQWKAQLAKGALELNAKLPDTPLADAYALFASAIPELKQAQIEGRIRLDARLRLPSRELALKPHIEGFAVSGLGTESLLSAVPACHGKPSSLQFGRWLPRAVIAAEDQRFVEHNGYDLDEMAAAWSGHTAPGASTLSQQLAKLLFTGDARSPQRKLRELLYAVELDRTLGKARVLSLYLAIAPWGEGQCGAQAAARHYLNKHPNALTPTEAAWLASLLHNPDRELAQLATRGQVNTERVGWVIAHLRPLRADKRDALLDALPAWSPGRR
ncbi:biosynthetic peptidoglycan transglycosylase [Piscinibacter sp.]|uniref:biosynthetic peptidoglycan transglycosylase n=1 Tax=Piscinibacter sp. TaxID=1903157 RepID=UPI00355A331A